MCGVVKRQVKRCTRSQLYRLGDLSEKPTFAISDDIQWPQCPQLRVVLKLRKANVGVEDQPHRERFGVRSSRSGLSTLEENTTVRFIEDRVGMEDTESVKIITLNV